jgi:prolyl oligopeptidase
MVVEVLIAQAPPVTARKPVADVIHGVTVIDPYRWLEDQKSPATRKWIVAENRYTDSLLDRLPERAYLKTQLGRLARIDRTSVPIVRKDRLFFTRQRATDEQAILFYRDGLKGQDHVIVNPIPLSKDHSTTAEFEDVSQDGRYVAYSIRVGGVDETTIHIKDLKTGSELPDGLPTENYWSFSLKPDMSGYYYCPHVNLVGLRVKYHAIGAPHSDDSEVFGKGYGPEFGMSATVTEDGHYLIIGVDKGESQSEVYAKDLLNKGSVFPVVTGMDAQYQPDYADGKFYVLTNLHAQNRHIYRIDPDNTARTNWKEVVPAGSDSIDSFTLVGGKIYVKAVHNVVPRVRVYEPEGKPDGEVPAPGIGDLSLPSGQWKNPSAFFDFQGFTAPRSIYHLITAVNKSTLWYRTVVPGVDTSALTTKQVWCRSKDGTKVPMFMVYRKGLVMDGKRPTVITGYGGFDISELPYFSGMASILAKNGAVYVDVNLRGGGEFGEAWHSAGMLGRKQNVFDDLYAATRWLIANHVTNPRKDAVIGGSNGGLLVGAAITQHPELYQAAVCEYPLLDMLRYQLFLQGPQWVPEYGSANDAAQFKWLFAYSPYQHVRRGVKYPATLFETGDGDTRVAPLHARKMTAMMQWATGSKRPILLHYQTQAGHSGGESVTQAIDSTALVFGFLFHELGIRPKD